MYIDLLWIEDFFNALEELMVEGYFRCNISTEKKFIKNIFSNNFSFASDIGLKIPVTIIDFSIFINQFRKKLENFAIKKSDPLCLIDYIHPHSVGYLGRELAKELTSFCERFQQKGSGDWYIKVCFDEAEFLEDNQKTLINSIVRLSTSYLFFIISYISDIEKMSETTLSNLTLGSADRKIIDLDNMDNSRFRSFAEGVSKVRVNAVLKDIKSQTSVKNFNLTHLLGKLNLNYLLKKSLNKSENKDFSKKWLKISEDYQMSPFFKGDSDEDLSSTPPIYQSYLIEKLNIKLPTPDDPNWARRKQESAEIRKRNVSAYLCMCDEMGHEPYFAYDRMVLQMSDKCIRDFLRQMDNIFKKSRKSIEKFITAKNISVEIQNQSLKNASHEKKDFIKRSLLKAPNEIERLIDGLAQITSSMHAKNGITSLKTHERGIFVLDTNNITQGNNSEILELIKQAGEAGYLKIRKGYGSPWKFQVHASLAAAYFFSYRGSHNEVKISIRDLKDLAFSYDDEEHKKKIKYLLSRVSPNDPNADSKQKSLW